MRLELTTLRMEIWCSSNWSIKNIDIIVYFTSPFICNIKFKSCLRSSLYYLSKKFFLNIKLELILHNISRGVKKIASFQCRKKSISKVGRYLKEISYFLGITNPTFSTFQTIRFNLNLTFNYLQISIFDFLVVDPSLVVCKIAKIVMNTN